MLFQIFPAQLKLVTLPLSYLFKLRDRQTITSISFGSYVKVMWLDPYFLARQLYIPKSGPMYPHTHTWSKRLARYVFRPDNLLCLNVLWQLLFYLYLKGGPFSCREKKMKLLGHVSWTNISVWHPRALPLSHLSRRWTERSFPEECVWIEDWFGEMGHGLACSQMMKLTCKRHSMLMPSL